MILSTVIPMKTDRTPYALIFGMALLLSPIVVMAGPKRHVSAPAAPKIQALTVMPARVTLSGPYAEAHLLIDGKTTAGTVLDVSAKAAYTVADPRIATFDADGVLRPHKDGATVITVRLAGQTARVPVTVQKVAKAGPPSFLNDVLPILTHAGCNQGACHGAAAGKGGFKLSLLGYDPDSDFEAITRAANARRITRTQPENSLLLRKPTLAVSHRGGKRLEVGSADYRLLRTWIAAGAPGPLPKEPQVARLEVTPAVRTLSLGQTQRFTVRALYSDGSWRDATGETLFTASDESTASVSPDGEAKATGPGEGAVVIRYQGLVTTARVVSPFGPPRPAARATAAPVDASAQIDRLALQKLDALGLTPSPRCTDSDFLRRASLDVIGQLPTPEEVRAFLADHDPQKRAKLVDSLLARSEYIDYWTMQWGDLLRCSRQALTEKGMYTFNAWIRQCVADDTPWDQFARDLLLAQGSTYKDGPVNYYRALPTAQERAETTSQVFLGVRIACARCHNHPYDRWTQNQYYQMAAFFVRVGSKVGERKDDQVLYATSFGDVRHPKTQKTVTPCALDATPLPADYSGDRRQALADWLTSPQNPFFAHSIVNRIWKHYLGRGFVEQVDDLRATNPPSNQALFDWLAQDLIAHHYDLKYLMRSILLSQTYQRSADPVGNNRRDTKFYSHYLFKRLGAEQMLDALAAATKVPEKFAGYPLGMHAEALPDTSVSSYFLDLFGRPARNTSCACERTDDPNLGQVLHLVNSGDINTRLTSKTGRIQALLDAKLPDSRVVEELYLASVSRFPTDAEAKRAVHSLAIAKDRRQTTEDLMWALLNSNEFRYNH